MDSVAYWEKPDGSRAAYEFVVVPIAKGRRGWAAYQATMATIMEVDSVLREEGYSLRYRKEES